MRVALVTPRPSENIGFGGDTFLEPLNLLYLSSFLLQEGHETKVVDQLVHRLTDRQVLQDIIEFKPDLLGISMCETNFVESHNLAREIKAACNIPVVVGGAHVTANPSAADYEFFDIGVIGEGEYTLHEIVMRLEGNLGLEEISGTVLAGDGELKIATPRKRIDDLDSLPFPERRFFDPKKLGIDMMFPINPWKTSGGLAGILSSRGCGHNCGFCPSMLTWKGRWIGRSPENVMEEIRILRKERRIDRFVFLDEEMNFDKQRSLNLFHLLRDEAEETEWFAATTVRCLDMETADAAVGAGLKGLFIGYESGAPEIVNRLKKGYSIDQAVEITRYLQSRKVFLSGSFIIGLPWESHETLAQTREFIKRLNLDVLSMSFFRPHLKLPFTNIAIRDGLWNPTVYNPDTFDQYEPSMKTYHLTKREVKKALSRTLFAAYIRPTYWARIFYRILRRPVFLFGYWTLALVILKNVAGSFFHRRRA
jgi:radical SAM superfamily enzyme YgiQ (UPF0313 family)